MTRIFALLALALPLIALTPNASHAYGERLEVNTDDHHYFVHAGNCSRSITLVRACTCPDEAEIIAQEYRNKNYLLVWVKTTPNTY